MSFLYVICYVYLKEFLSHVPILSSNGPTRVSSGPTRDFDGTTRDSNGLTGGSNGSTGGSNGPTRDFNKSNRGSRSLMRALIGQTEVPVGSFDGQKGASMGKIFAPMSPTKANWGF